MLLPVQVRTLIRRHRRILAACCAGLAAMLTLAVIRAPQASTGQAAGAPPALGAGEVAVPVSLASGAHAGVLTSGDVIDLVAVPRAEDHVARVVAREATVLSIATAGFGSADGSVVVIAVPRAEALAIADAMTGFAFTAWVTSAIPAGAMPTRTTQGE